jgi:hypothetical protein
MASTITVQKTIDWALTFLRYQPVTIGTGNEPALTNANVVLQTIIGEPFTWRWNRASFTQATVAGTQDYTVVTPTFGFLEKATVTDSNGVITELEVKDVLSAETANLANQARPSFISTQNDDNADNITFRVMPVPDAVYTITVVFQKQAVLLTALTGAGGTWAPIPDYMSYIYNRGFLALSLEMADDPRFQVEHTRFLASLVSAAEGLPEADKNLFLGNALDSQAHAQALMLRTQQAIQARGT